MPLSPKFQTIASHTLIPGFLRPGAVIVDVGANIGEFSLAMTARFDCRCYAIEASPEYCSRIPAGGRVEKFHYAIAGESGFVELHVPSAEAYLAKSDFPSLVKLAACDYASTVRVPSRSLAAFCAENKLREIDLLKMDIEGAELAVFDSCDDAFLKTIGQLTVEFHEWAGVGSVADVQRIIRRMEGLGFFVFSFARKEYLDVLFVNKRYMSRADFGVAWATLWGPRAVRSLARRLGVVRFGRVAGGR